MTKVRARFSCAAVTRTNYGTEEVRFTPTTGPKGDGNVDWSKYTPSGELTMSITAEGAQGAFEPGQDYYLDITPAED